MIFTKLWCEDVFLKNGVRLSKLITLQVGQLKCYTNLTFQLFRFAQIRSSSSFSSFSSVKITSKTFPSICILKNYYSNFEVNLLSIFLSCLPTTVIRFIQHYWHLASRSDLSTVFSVGNPDLVTPFCWGSSSSFASPNASQNCQFFKTVLVLPCDVP